MGAEKKKGKYELTCTKVVKETDAALLCDTEEHGQVWVPKSQIDDDSETYSAGTSGTLIVSQWFAEQRGWA